MCYAILEIVLDDSMGQCTTQVMYLALYGVISLLGKEWCNKTQQVGGIVKFTGGGSLLINCMFSVKKKTNTCVAINCDFV